MVRAFGSRMLKLPLSPPSRPVHKHAPIPAAPSIGAARVTGSPLDTFAKSSDAGHFLAGKVGARVAGPTPSSPRHDLGASRAAGSQRHEPSSGSITTGRLGGAGAHHPSGGSRTPIAGPGKDGHRGDIVGTAGDVLTTVGFVAGLVGAATVGAVAGGLGFGLVLGTKIDRGMQKNGLPPPPGVPGPAPAGDAGVVPAAGPAPAPASSGNPDGGVAPDDGSVDPDDDTTGSDGNTGRPAPNTGSSPSNRHVDVSNHVTRGEMIGQPSPEQPSHGGETSTVDPSIDGDRDPAERATHKRKQKGISLAHRRAARAQPAPGHR